MSKRGRDDMEATTKEYEENKAARVRENNIKMQALNIEATKRAFYMEPPKKPLSIESILEGCGMKKGKPRNKLPKTAQTDLIIGCESLRPRAASTQKQHNSNIVDQTAENIDLEVVDGGMKKTIAELFTMLKIAEVDIKKEHKLLMVNKTTSLKKAKDKKRHFKKSGKLAAAAAAKKPKVGPKPETECF